MATTTQTVYPVSAVTRYLRELLESNRHLADIWVEGEISNLSLPASGHIYFTLKDANSSIRCAFFRNRIKGQRDRLEQGALAVIHGSMSVYEARGELSFIVDFVQPAGTGALQAEFERPRAQFEAEGLFAEERKRPLPRFPRRVGVVTSASGAVFHDITTVLARRWPAATILLQPSTVQGETAADEIAEAIDTIARDHAPEVIIVARGGGSAEDLWAFNEESVIRAIYRSPVPVVSAVGHETDTTLADFVADMRAPTPSAAAELVAPDRADVARSISSIQRRAEVQLTRAIAASRETLDGSVATLIGALPNIAEQRARVVERRARIARVAAGQLATTRERFAEAGARIGALSPLATLERGFAVIERDDGSLVTSTASLASGDQVMLRLQDGRRAARIEEEDATP